MKADVGEAYRTKNWLKFAASSLVSSSFRIAWTEFSNVIRTQGAGGEFELDWSRKGNILDSEAQGLLVF